MIELSPWFEDTKLGEDCTYNTHCKDCKPDGDCDSCMTINGRWISAVSDYASTCDWCRELTHHDLMVMDPKTQLGYCRECLPKLPEEIKKGINSQDGYTY